MKQSTDYLLLISRMKHKNSSKFWAILKEVIVSLLIQSLGINKPKHKDEQLVLTAVF